jgi:hypothetical protein
MGFHMQQSSSNTAANMNYICNADRQHLTATARLCANIVIRAVVNHDRELSPLDSSR